MNQAGGSLENGIGPATNQDSVTTRDDVNVSNPPASDILSNDASDDEIISSSKRVAKEDGVEAIQEKYSIRQQDSNTFLMHGETFKVIQQSADELHRLAKTCFLTVDSLDLSRFTSNSKLSLKPNDIPDLEVKRSMSGKTQYRYQLLKQMRGKGRCQRLVVKKGALPNFHTFLARSGSLSLLVLERFELRMLARAGGMREVSGYKYDCKQNSSTWPYPCGRPKMKICWQYRTRCITNLSAVALQLHILWSAVRWDDLSGRTAPSESTVTTEDEIRKKELLDRRDVGAHGLRSQFLVREIVIHLQSDEPRKGPPVASTSGQHFINIRHILQTCSFKSAPNPRSNYLKSAGPLRYVFCPCSICSITRARLLTLFLNHTVRL